MATMVAGEPITRIDMSTMHSWAWPTASRALAHTVTSTAPRKGGLAVNLVYGVSAVRCITDWVKSSETDHRLPNTKCSEQRCSCRCKIIPWGRIGMMKDLLWQLIVRSDSKQGWRIRQCAYTTIPYAYHELKSMRVAIGLCLVIRNHQWLMCFQRWQ